MPLARLPYNHDLIISKRENITYLTGLKQVHPVNREALLFITKDQAVLYHSAFLIPPPLPYLKSVPMSPDNNLEKILQKTFTSGKITFEAHNLTYAEYQRIQATLPQTSLSPTTNLIENIRLIKDKAEIKAIQKACAITAKTMSWICDLLINRANKHSGSDQERQRLGSPGVGSTELELSRAIEQKLYKLGADSLAFPIITAFDQNAALPHHIPDKTKLKPNSIILLDFGCMVDGYTSDISRTICLDKSNSEFNKIQAIVHSAYAAGLTLLRHHFNVSELTNSLPKHSGSDQKRQRLVSPGVKASDLDLVVRSVIEKAGFEKEFIHTSGHGLGLEIHEQPSLSSHNQQKLKPGMVITLEPGIYLSGKFGYRHENTLLLM